MSRTGYLWDERCLGHQTSTIHPERPDRVRGLEPERILVDLPGLRMRRLDAALGLPWVQRVHDREYIDEVRAAYSDGIGALDPTSETVVRKDTFDVALCSAAATVSLVDAVGKGELSNAFAAVRPPGHHARGSFTRGFCYFNNVAIGARYAQQALGLERILIVDWDVHPADGTMEIFYEDAEVHVLSLHQRGLFPESVGSIDQTGSGTGEGATHNMPVEPGCSGSEYLQSFEGLLDHAASTLKPELVLVSCGFDAHAADPLGGLSLQEDDFVRMTRMVKEVAAEHSQGRLVSVLEGGYNPVVLQSCVRRHLEELMS